MTNYLYTSTYTISMSLHYQQGNQIGPDLKFTPDSPLVNLLAQNPKAQVYADVQRTSDGDSVIVEALLPEDRLFVAGRISLEQALFLSRQLQDDRQVPTCQGAVTPPLAQSNPQLFAIAHALKYALSISVVIPGLLNTDIKIPPYIQVRADDLEAHFHSLNL